MIKRYVITILAIGLLPLACVAETRDGAPVPGTGQQVGGKGADGNFHYLLLANDGSLSVAASSNVITTATPSTATATTTSSTILAANASRKDAVLVNYGATNGVFLARGATATVGNGIYLAPNGGSYSIDSNNLYRGI